MCGSAANLFFGLLVRALDLVIAARHWPHCRAVLHTLDSISALRERGQLKVGPGADGHGARVAKVPREVWDLVKAHVAAVLWEESEHAFVNHVHNGGLDDCSCADCVRAAGFTPHVPRRPLRELSHFDMCIDCRIGMWQLRGVEGLLFTHAQTIRKVLAAFDLDLVCPIPISCDPFLQPRLNVAASAAISLPDVACTEVHAQHGDVDFEHQVVEVNPRFFLLPHDAQDRFHRLLRSVPLAKYGEQQGHVSSGNSLRAAGGDSGGAGGLTATTSGGASSWAEGGGPAKWLMWGCVRDCGQ